MQPDVAAIFRALDIADRRTDVWSEARQALLDVEQELDALDALLSVVGEIGALTEGQLVKITKLDRLTVRERQDRGAGLLDKRGVPASWRAHASSFLGSLSFRALRLANVRRCETHYHPVAAWSLTDWLTCVAGELGELAGAIKNVRRREVETEPNGHAIGLDDRREIADEAADTVIYLDLLCARAGIDLGDAVRRKFNEVSDKRLSSNIRLEERADG